MGKVAPHKDGHVSVSEGVGRLGSGFNPYSKKRKYSEKTVNIDGFLYFEDKVFAEIERGYKKPSSTVKGKRRKFYFLDMNHLETILTLEEAKKSGTKLMPVEADEALYDKGRRNGISGLVKDGTIEYEVLNGQKCLSAGVVLNLIAKGYGKWRNIIFRLSQELIKYVVIPEDESEKLKLKNLLNKTGETDESSVTGGDDSELLGIQNLLNALKTFHKPEGYETKSPQGVDTVKGYLYRSGIKEMMEDSDPRIARTAGKIYHSLGENDIKSVEYPFQGVLGPSPLDEDVRRFETFASVLMLLDNKQNYRMKDRLVKILSEFKIFEAEKIREGSFWKDIDRLEDIDPETRNDKELVGIYANLGVVMNKWKSMTAKKIELSKKA